MARSKARSPRRCYLRLHLWLRQKCDRLTARQRMVVLSVLSLIYLVCCVVMIAQLFQPKEKEEEAIVTPQNILMDSPIQRDTLSAPFTPDSNHLA